MFSYLTNSAKKELADIRLGNRKAALRIEAFVDSLEDIDDLKSLSNARKLVGFKNAWRFRVGEYRLESRVLKNEKGFEIAEIIAITQEPIKEVLEIYKISPRQGAYKK